jgi:hypothetical protein
MHKNWLQYPLRPQLASISGQLTARSNGVELAEDGGDDGIVVHAG